MRPVIARLKAANQGLKANGLGPEGKGQGRPDVGWRPIVRPSPTLPQ